MVIHKHSLIHPKQLKKFLASASDEDDNQSVKKKIRRSLKTSETCGSFYKHQNQKIFLVSRKLSFDEGYWKLTNDCGLKIDCALVLFLDSKQKKN